MGLFDIFSTSSGDAAAARNKKSAKKYAKKGFNESSGYINAATDKGAAQYAAALQPFEQLYGQDQGAKQLYLDALGINGPDAAAAARAKFSYSPGFDIAEQGILRNNAAAGGLRSGQTSEDLANYEWMQQYNPWLDRLMGQGNQSYQDAAGKAGVLTNLANLYQQQGQDLSNLSTHKYDTLTNANQNYNQDLWNNQQAANQNMWNAINAGAQLAGKAAGSYFGSKD